MIEFDVDMSYLLEEGELDCVILNDENGEHEPVEFAPIMRCRDCKYAEIDQSDHEYREPLWCDFHCMDVKPGNFCAWAKPRELEPPIFDDERGRYYE